MSVQPKRSVAAPSRKRYYWAAVLAVLALLVIVKAWTVEPVKVKPFLADPKPVVLAHQGASGHAPSNTMESFALSMAQGADILELDVHMTKENVIVVSHDETIDRLTNGKGAIKTMTLAELRKFDFGHGFTPDKGQTYPYRGKGVTIPTLEEVFQKFPGVRVNIELKQADPPMEDQVLALVRKYNMEEKVLINAFATEPVERWREKTGGKTAIGATRADMYEFAAYWIPHLDWLYSPKVDAFQLPTQQKLGPFTIRLDSPRLLERAHKLGIKVHYWTINDEATMKRLLQAGADGIITDYPDRAVKVLKELGLR